MPTRDEKVNTPAPGSRIKKAGSTTLKPKGNLAVGRNRTLVIQGPPVAREFGYTPAEATLVMDHLATLLALYDKVAELTEDTGPAEKIRSTMQTIAAQQAFEAQPKPQEESSPDEAEMQALMADIDKGVKEVHQRIDRVLARWDD